MTHHDPVLLWDVLRILVTALGFLGGVATGKAGWNRLRDHRAGRHPDRPHPAAYFAAGLALIVVSFDRFEYIGHTLNLPPMIFAYLVVGLAWWALVSHFTYRRKYRVKRAVETAKRAHAREKGAA